MDLAQKYNNNENLNPFQIWWKGLKRDLRMIPLGVKLVRAYKRVIKQNLTIGKLLHNIAEKYPDKPAIILVDGKTWTFKEIDELSNSLANFMLKEGYVEKDCVGLLMENIPEFVIFWLGLAKIGVRAALINNNQTAGPLVHSINIAKCRAMIVSGCYLKDILDIGEQLAPDMRYYVFGGQAAGIDTHIDQLEERLVSSPTTSPPPSRVSIYDPAIYIYTSGTTGLPKAALVSHIRYYISSLGFSLYIGRSNIIYNTLPLYHSAGGLLGIGQILSGNTVVIRRKFSASAFWEDCTRYNCTVVQYIGEQCRYLLCQPTKPSDTGHQVKVALGNGLRPQIWRQFMERFNIEKVVEFYASTEGMCGSVNLDNTVGAVGYISQRLSRLVPMALFKVDQETGELTRGQNGLGIKCKPGEPGEMMGQIKRRIKFDGYLDKPATRAKLTENVFKMGDKAYRSGDLLVTDKHGCLYFLDRLGDTYRWKGENVSTAEVEATVSDVTQLNDAVVYGVELPGMEGRAGMVAILENVAPVETTRLYADLSRVLPGYAKPLFVRLLSDIDLTGTFKLQKSKYRQEGYNPDGVGSDQLYYADNASRNYSPLTESIYNDIQQGRLRF